MMTNRRAMILSAVALPTLRLRHASAQVGTSEASPVGIPPDEAYEMLLAAPVTTPLLASDSGLVVPSRWVDEGGDSDLEGAVGGVLFGTAEQAAEYSIGVMIVHHDAKTAAGRVTADTRFQQDTTTIRDLNIGGAVGVTVVELGDEGSNYAQSVVSIGNVIVVGLATDIPDAELELRSIANLTALLDHYRRVLGSA